MRLRWTVVDVRGDGPSSVDLEVRCPRGTRLAEVAPALTTALGADPGSGTPVAVDGRCLDPDAVVGVDPLLDGAVLTVGHVAPRPRDAPERHLLELVVTGGPDAGTVLPLPRGRLTVGRAEGCDVRLRDPRLSRTHCVLSVTAAGVRVVDAGSTNGTLAPVRPAAGAGDGPIPRSATTRRATDGARWSPWRARRRPRGRDGTVAPATGRPTGPVEQVLRLGDVWQAGAVTLRLRATAEQPESPLARHDTGVGTREVRIPPRTRSPEEAPRLRLPTPARAGRSAAFPVLTVLLPALAAGGLAWWTRSPVYLLLAALGPLLVAGSWWSARREARREGAMSRRAHARACAEVNERARSAAEELALSRARAMPDAATLLADGTSVSGHLWERGAADDDLLRVRLGRSLRGGTDDDAGGSGHRGLLDPVTVVDHDGRVTEVRTPDDLVSVDLGSGPVGVVEPGPDPSCARFLVGQLVALVPPTVLAVVPVLSGRATATWGWLRFLPHRGLPGEHVPDDPGDALAEVARIVRRRTEDALTGRRPAALPRLLVVVDDVTGQLARIDVQQLQRAHEVGVHVLVVAREAAALPQLCSTVVLPGSPDGVEGLLTRPADGAADRVLLDRVPRAWAVRLARALAPLRPAAPDGTTGALPVKVALADVLDLGVEAVVSRWAQPGDGLEVPLGVGPRGAVHVDLTTAGPHALVAGTTGAGKSELLRSWLLAMAATRPPDRLCLLLVDYKGGATFDELTDLPHCVGLLTDLDGGATSRVLHALRAEVRRRERLFAAAGARDLPSYRALGVATGEPVPRLLVVVDEFRVLAEEAPDVLSQFVRLAATGRSLGIHLVLATQRPGGVVSTDIRANTGLRIALRVQDASESRDVIDRPDAVDLPASAPGRAVLVSADVAVTVQTAWTGGTEDGASVEVTVVGAPAPPVDPGAPDPTGSTSSAGSGGGAREAVAAVRQAASALGTGQARAPWLPPLPAVVLAPDAAATIGMASDSTAPGSTAPGSTASDCTASDGTTGAAPSPGSLLLGVADLPWSQSRAPVAWDPTADGPLAVLGTTRSGRTSTLLAAARAARAAGTPTVLLSGTAGQDDHVVDVLSSALTAPADDGALQGASAARPACRLLVLVDDVDDLLDPAADPAAADLLARLVRSGHRHGIGVALAGGRGLAASRVAAGIRCRVVHRTVDRGDAVLCGVPSGAPALPAVPGRCHAVGLRVPGARTDALDGGEAIEAQVLMTERVTEVPRTDGTEVPRTDGTEDPTAEGVPLPGWLPRPLPTSVGTSALPPSPGGGLVLGLLGPDRSPWVLDLDPGGLVVVAGPSGSGRTTALRTVVRQASDAGLAVAMGPGHTPPGGERLADVLVLDDADRTDEGYLAALEQWLLTGTGPVAGTVRAGATVVLSAATGWFADSYRGLPLLARHTGRGVVLSPARTDVRDVLGYRGGPSQLERHPGRGVLLDRGRPRRVQVAVAPG